MNCLLCGRKLAIFRKSSIGDFCGPEHRALYLAEQSEAGLARLMEVRRPAGPPKEAPELSAFLTEWTRPSYRPARCQGYFQPLQTVMPVASVRTAVLEPDPPEPRLLPWLAASPRVADGDGLWLDIAATPLAPSTLHLAGPPAPHVAEPAPEAAGWVALIAIKMAREGALEPHSAAWEFDFTIEITWPRLRCDAALELPEPEVVTAAPVEEEEETQDTAWEEPERPAYELDTIPAPPITPLFEPEPAEPEAPRVAEPAPVPAETEPSPEPSPGRQWQLPRFFTPREGRVSARALRQARRFGRDEYYDFQEVTIPVIPQGSTGEGWRTWLVRGVPSAPTVFGLFSCVFLALSLMVLASVPKGSSSGKSSFRLDSLRSVIRDRASLRIFEDFRSGLSAWDGPSGWAKDWSYDQAGFLRPGRFGLWRQSLKLKDYRMEFLGQIEHKSMGWVFRATDVNNYYAAKLTITKPGPLPSADLVHYAVVGGRPGPRVRVPLPFPIRNDTIYQVQVDIKNDLFATRINGRMVDTWSDARHSSGGVGFLSDAGELARVRWLRVSNKDDFLGRICSYLTAQTMLPDDDVLSATAYPFLVHPIP